ncbi:LacI family DNA-binding transcriptional regulator [Tengunoibacter tsumagoiensis]|uniref:DNA-binding transcriptional regulator CytR n=1 Tax=Tengunoibacter tsumagoiensis TaxID=2014871 RepID=A0A402A8H0_9CHLR|nr:LacI family DNA-binding transcriptional regulator [Tengunoibacter tsumagoiensis]GCE15295.1 DNA-binding transcriptional regulator CytR [Tengunoibacter tsumagoiensis]
MQRKRVTQKDVAAVAGVSTATVMRVLYEQGYVAEETRKVVEEAIQRTGYHVNAVARSLRHQRTTSIGHILHSLVPNPFFAGVALGVEEEASRWGWKLLMISVRDDERRERLGVETFIQQQVDAIIFTTPISEENVQVALDAGIFVVQVERPTTIPTPSVIVDNYTGAIQAMEHLIALGHKRIAYIGIDPELLRAQHHFGRYVEEERLKGYLDSLHKHQIPLNKRFLDLGAHSSFNRTIPLTLSQSLRDMIVHAERPTAIFASTDTLAAHVLQQLHDYRLRVPDDISIISFDDTYAPYLTPPLTTVAQPMMEIGKAAVHLILDHFQEEPSALDAFQQKKLATHLVVRSSTASIL